MYVCSTCMRLDVQCVHTSIKHGSQFILTSWIPIATPQKHIHTHKYMPAAIKLQLSCVKNCLMLDVPIEIFIIFIKITMPWLVLTFILCFTRTIRFNRLMRFKVSQGKWANCMKSNKHRKKTEVIPKLQQWLFEFSIRLMVVSHIQLGSTLSICPYQLFIYLKTQT